MNTGDQAHNQGAIGMSEQTHSQGLFLPSSGVYSPSFVESYMTCPYRWFLERGLKLTEKAQDLGPREVGTIFHSVLHQVAVAAQATRAGRIAAENIAELSEYAAALYDQEMTSYLADERELCPLTQEEQSYVAAKKQDLLRFLRRDAQFNLDFKPTYLEFEISGTYAKRPFRGFIDRVDTCGNAAVVIDYKYGSNDCVPYTNEKTGVLKVQAAIYAQLLKREYNLTPVASWYVCTSKFKVGGALDGDWFGYDDKDRVIIDGLNLTSLAVTCKEDEEPLVEELKARSFAEYLDLVEKRVEQALDELESGALEKRKNEKGSTCPLAGICLCEEGSYGF